MLVSIIITALMCILGVIFAMLIDKPYFMYITRKHEIVEGKVIDCKLCGDRKSYEVTCKYKYNGLTKTVTQVIKGKNPYGLPNRGTLDVYIFDNDSYTHIGKPSGNLFMEFWWLMCDIFPW